MSVSLCTFTVPNNDGDPKDEVRFSFVIEGALLTAGGLQTLWTAVMDTAYPGASLHSSAALASCLVLTGGAITGRAYDITAFLDGSPHGSPYLVEAVTGTGPGGDSRGNQLCAVIGFQSAAYLSTPVDGPIAAIPSSESAIDQGAPATHMGTTKLQSRQSGRIYFGPLDGSVIGIDANANPELTGTWKTNFSENFHDAIVTPGVFRVWSRRNAAVYPITQGWVDNSIGTRRVKAFKGAGRTPLV